MPLADSENLEESAGNEPLNERRLDLLEQGSVPTWNARGLPQTGGFMSMRLDGRMHESSPINRGYSLMWGGN